MEIILERIAELEKEILRLEKLEETYAVTQKIRWLKSLLNINKNLLK